MVKADVRRDYYADLGLAPSAESEDVKRQFRKLALKYHPDRNPGKEIEFNAKFQAIQAAHEILSDPQQRLKYDTDRLRNGYYAPKPTPTRREPANSYTTPRTSSTKASFSERPKSFHTGPSTGAQRFASYARAAPRQPWEKMRDEPQTRADAYRGFQEMKGNPMPGWTSFDPRTGRSGQSGTMPRPNPSTSGQSARPKSAYEYFKTSFAKSTGPDPAHAQSTRKKQGFAPHAAGGDEPMASKTSSYRSAPRFEREFAPAPSPTSRKPTAGFPEESLGTPDFERTSSKYASTGGEKTFFSSAWLGRSSSVRSSPKSPKSPKPRPRTNPPSPTPPDTGRHRSASPNLKGMNRNYDSTSSSGLDDDEEELPFVPKPKAVPKSRLRHQKFGNSTQSSWNTAVGPDSDSAASSSGRYASDTPMFFKNINGANSSNPRGHSQNGAFKSNSHDDLRKSFSSSHKDKFDYFAGASPSSRGRASARNSPPRAGHSTSTNSKREPSRSESLSKPQMPFVEASYLDNDWGEAFKFKNLSEALPNNDTSQRQYNTVNAQRTRSPRKQTRLPTKVRPAPQPASVATESEEAAKTAFEGRAGQESAESVDADGEAMDLDDELPSGSGGTKMGPAKAANSQAKRKSVPKPHPASKSTGKDGVASLFNLKILSSIPPLTSSNNGGLEDLKDVYATLPFESRAKAPKTAMRDVRPRELNCPNPPKRPEPPQLVAMSLGSQQLGIPRTQWDRYMAEMSTYMREWNNFNRRMQGHFLARQSVLETGMAPNWISAVGDSGRVGANGVDGDDGLGGGTGDESDESLAPRNGKWGFDTYVRWLDEDDKVHKHWDVSRERHRESMLKHKQMRDWALSGGKIF